MERCRDGEQQVTVAFCGIEKLPVDLSEPLVRERSHDFASRPTGRPEPVREKGRITPRAGQSRLVVQVANRNNPPDGLILLFPVSAGSENRAAVAAQIRS